MGSKSRWKALGLVVVVVGVVALLLSGCAAKPETPTTPTTPGTPTEPEEELPYFDWKYHNCLALTDAQSENTGYKTNNVMWDAIFQDIEKATDGHIKTTPYFLSALGYKPSTIYEPVGAGLVEFAGMYACHTFSRWTDIGAVDCLGNYIPYPIPEDLFRKLEEISTRYVNDMVAEENAVCVASEIAGYGSGTMCFAREPVWPMTGFKLRSYGPVPSYLIEVMHGTPLVVEFSELYMALQRGIVDGGFGVNESRLVTMGFHEVCNYSWARPFAMPNSGGGAMHVHIMNKDVWDSVPTEWQEIIRESCRKWFIAKLDSGLAARDYYEQILKENNWCTFVPVPDGMLEYITETVAEGDPERGIEAYPTQWRADATDRGNAFLDEIITTCKDYLGIT